MFGEKSVLSKQKSFSTNDLFSYAETVLRTLEKNSRRNSRSTYGWLSSGSKMKNVCHDIEELRPFIDKMSPESCTSIALQIDKLLQHHDVTPASILDALRSTLEEHYTCQLMEANCKKSREKLKKNNFRQNRVKPILTPPGREATVSFILKDYVF